MTRPRRVSVVFHEEVPGGATLSVMRLVPILEQRGWEFSFWAPAPSTLFGELQSRGWNVSGAERPVAFSLAAMRLPPGPAGRVRAVPGYLRAWRRFLADQEPDIVHANSLFTLPEALDASRRGHAAIFHVHEMVPRSVKGRIAIRLAERYLDQTVAVSGACAAALEELGAHPAIVYEGADIPDSPDPPRPEGTEIRVGTVGVLSMRKGSDLFVRAAELVKEATDEVSFTMVGAATDALDADFARGVIERADRAGVGHRERADVPAFLRGLDVFVLPSRRDPFPISMLEAMGSGLAVVGADQDGLREQITPESGILVPPEDPSALAEAILRLRDPELRRRLGAGARKRAVERFGLEPQADGLEAVYESVLGL